MSTTESLQNRDYVLAIDRSGSMGTRDCNNKSRWDASREATEAIANKVAPLDPDGIKVVAFGSSVKIFDNTTPDKVTQIYREVEPMGGTALDKALHQIFEDYATRKRKGQTKPNGEILLVMTDGVPDDEEAVAREIVKFTKILDQDNEYGIEFVQVGSDAHASAYLKRLDDHLEKEGAKFDIVNTKTMEELENTTITQALIDALDS